MVLKDKILTSIICIVGAILLVAILFFAITHKEPSLMGACWTIYNDKERVTLYESNGVKDCPKITWDKNAIPLIVKGVAYHQDTKNETITAVETAVRHTNQLLGFDGFSLTTETEADILITIGVPQDGTFDGPGGHMYHEKNNSKQKAFIEVYNVVEPILLNKVIVHELLHALGLSHDDWEGSVMYPSNDSKELTSFKQLWLSDQDKKVLQDLYSPR